MRKGFENQAKEKPKIYKEKRKKIRKFSLQKFNIYFNPNLF